MNKTPEPPLTESVNLKVSAPLYKALERLAEKQKCSIKYVAKKFLEAGVQRYGESMEADRAGTAVPFLGATESRTCR
jgi:predicted transcriptional regulator